jgi:hypothetical protein
MQTGGRAPLPICWINQSSNPFIAKYNPGSAKRMETLFLFTARDWESVTVPLIVGQRATGDGRRFREINPFVRSSCAQTRQIRSGAPREDIHG